MILGPPLSSSTSITNVKERRVLQLMSESEFNDSEKQTKMELVTGQDAAHQEDELIRIICKRKKQLLVTRSLLIESSSYFAAMLSEGSGWKETSNKAIELGSWSRKDLATILLCLKTKRTESIFKNVDRLFRAINYFSVTPLVEQCIEFKIANVSDKSVIDDMRFAERYSIGALKDKCIERLLKKLPEQMQSTRWRRKMHAEFLQQLLRHKELEVRNEDELLSLIDLWSSSGDRQSDRVKLLHEIRFAHLTEKAFNKCRQDPQCLEVPQFRILLETQRWSDLDEEVLSGRSCSRVHLHTVGFLEWPASNDRGEKLPRRDESADGALVYCSESETQSTTRGVFSEVYAKAMIQLSRSVVSGKGLYVCQTVDKRYRFSGARILNFSGFQHFSDSRDIEPSSTVVFPRTVFAVASPAVFGDNFCVAHLVLKAEPIPTSDTRYLKHDDFEELEVLRYHDGEATSRRLRMSTESESWKRMCCHLLSPRANKLVVNEDWTILCVPRQGILLVIDAPSPVGPIVEIPEDCWKLGSPYRIIVDTFSDIVIVGNVAYVLLRFIIALKLRVDREGSPVFLGSEIRGNITAYDLRGGKFILGHSLDLTSLFEKRELASSDRFELFLKVVDDEIFLVGVSSRVTVNSSRIPAVRNFVYRIRRSADRLCMTLVRDNASEEETLKGKQTHDLCWEGIPLNVDAHPCEHATMLQLKAFQESDPVRREKLRRFIW